MPKPDPFDLGRILLLSDDEIGFLRYTREKTTLRGFIVPGGQEMEKPTTDPNEQKKNQKPRAIVLRFVSIAALVQLSILIAVLLMGWLTGWWNTFDQYGQALVWAGVLAIGLGLTSIKGHYATTRSFDYQHSLSVTNQDSWERTKGNVAESMVIHRFLFLMVAVGCISILLGSLVQTISL